jgi:NAD-dependent deacetylase
MHQPTDISSRGSIVVLTGAGISVESGLPSFRGPDGLWEGWRLEDVATPEAFAREPASVQRFYDLRRRQLLSPEIRPNPAHVALAELERRWPGEVLIVTQNIDDLHERAGSRNLIHMHGELLRARCTACAAIHVCRTELALEHLCERCGRLNGLRPHVVWFGEMPLELDAIYAALGRCAVRRDRHLRPGLSGRWLRRGNPAPRPGAYGRAQPRAERRELPVCRPPKGPGQRDGAPFRR